MLLLTVTHWQTNYNGEVNYKVSVMCSNSIIATKVKFKLIICITNCHYFIRILAEKLGYQLYSSRIFWFLH